MFKKGLALLFAVTLWCYASSLAFAQSNSTPVSTPTTTSPNPKLSQAAERMRGRITKLGVGPRARIELLLRDKSKVKGYISYTDERYFVVVEPPLGVTTRLAYSNVRAIRGEDADRDKSLTIGIVLGLMILFGAGALGGVP